MAAEKLSYDDFIQTLNADNLAFVEELHGFLLNNGHKPTFESKKSGLLGSYKHTKTKKVVMNFLFRKRGLIVRIYGENISGYHDLLQTLPAEMVDEITGAGICKQLVSGGCSTRCSGYDFTIGGEHFQKCRYSCFEFLVTGESKPFIKAFVENETKARSAA
ncbi:MAG: hypothetical protein FWE32_07470 [Oscillospiraceae bacterium]|nr:hypothetical protein [Oscillospiraceae bacterium]